MGVTADFNHLCSSVVASSGPHSIGVTLFCYAHLATYRRGFTHEQDVAWYSGDTVPPYQMDVMQYGAIAATISEIKKPRVLFVGCGNDTPMWRKVTVFLKGLLTVVESNSKWAAACGAGNNDVVTLDKHLLPVSSRKQLESQKFDVIVVDGPPDAGGQNDRFKTAMWAFELARNSSTPTHIFVHDFTRYRYLTKMVARDIVLLGNTRPHKGLGHFLVINTT